MKISTLKLGIFLMALLILAFAISSLIWTIQTDAQVNPKPTFDTSEIESYKQQLTTVASNGNNQFAQQSLLIKLGMAEKEATQYALVAPAPKNPNATPRSSGLLITITRTFVTGIFNHGSSSYKPSEVTITSAWQGIIYGNYYQIEVGALVSDPSQGVVYYKVMSSNFAVIDMGRILTPVKSGAITLTDEKSLRLIIETENGNNLYFDVQSKQFVSSLSEVLPTPDKSIQTPTPITYP